MRNVQLIKDNLQLCQSVLSNLEKLPFKDDAILESIEYMKLSIEEMKGLKL